MSKEQRRADKRLLTIVGKLDELKAFQREHPEITTPHDIDGQIQKWYAFIYSHETS